MEIEIRQARMSDIPQLEAMEQGLIREERPFDPTIREDPVRYYNLPQLIEDPKSMLLVAESGGRLLSCGYASPRIPRHYLDHEVYAYLGFMFTLPEFRGMGLNGAIIEKLREWSRGQGLREFRLTVYTDNTPALKAYEKAGFAPHILEMRLRDD